MGCCYSQPAHKKFKNTGIDTPLFSFNGFKGWCRLVDAYDADSLTIIIPFAGKMYRINTRMYGIDTCEMKSKDVNNAQAAVKARNRVLQLVCKLPVIPEITKRSDVQKLLAEKCYVVWVECLKFDKYGRTLVHCRVSPRQNETLADILLKEKLAYPYFGGTKLTEKEQRTYMST